MNEHVLGCPQDKGKVLSELAFHRHSHAEYVRSVHPTIHFVSLADLTSSVQFSEVVDQRLLVYGIETLAHRLLLYGDLEVLDPQRVWVGINTTEPTNMFGGFHHPDQGYRYVQQTALLSLTGVLGKFYFSPTLISLELLRSYIHDTLHYNSYRTYRAIPSNVAVENQSIFGFYRLQYGINFRSPEGRSYSSKDPVSRSTTRNLGVIMEGAVDTFAQDIVARLADKIIYEPSNRLMEEYIYRDCTGRISNSDLSQLRDIEKKGIAVELSVQEKVYLKSLRLFNQYVTYRYRNFLLEFDPERIFGLHELLISSCLSGKLKTLVKYFDMRLSGKRNFTHLFKSPNYRGVYLSKTDY